MALFDALIALVAVLFFATVVGGKLGKHSSAKAHMHALACCFHGYKSLFRPFGYL